MAGGICLKMARKGTNTTDFHGLPSMQRTGDHSWEVTLPQGGQYLFARYELEMCAAQPVPGGKLHMHVWKWTAAYAIVRHHALPPQPLDHIYRETAMEDKAFMTLPQGHPKSAPLWPGCARPREPRRGYEQLSK